MNLMGVPMKRLILAVFALTACTGAGLADQPAEWVLSSVDGVAPEYTATLDLSEPGRLAGQAPCNRYFAALTREGDSFQPGQIGATRMACLQIKGEAEYLALLSAVTTAVEQDGVLILTGAGHEMRFVPPTK